MEIKVGDKVRVSSKLPRIYKRFGSWIAPHYECEVVEIEEGMALLDSIPDKHVFLFPLKYLTKVNAEARFKKGDRVKYVGKEHPEFWGEIFTVDGEIFYNDYHKNMQIDSIRCEKYNVCNVPLSDLKPYTEPTAPTIEVGSEEWVDKQVWNCKLKQHGVIKRIANGCAEVFTQYGEHKVWSLVDLFDEYDEPFGNWKSVQPKEQTEAEKKPNVGSIKIPVEVDLTDSYWEAYTADLAKEIALKVANKYSDPKEAADYAVSVAKAVVENLKKK